jgi:PAS domain-containing protein
MGAEMVETLKSLVLIRAKHLAESITVPAWLADADGNLVFFNEAAELLIGRTFADAGPMPASEWIETFNIRDRNDSTLKLEEVPGWVALQEHRPQTGHVKFTAQDGKDHFVSTAAIPLSDTPEHFEGVLIVFWEEPED